MLGPTKKLGSIGSAVLTFVGYIQTDRQRDHAKEIGFGNDLVFVFGHLRPGVDRLYQPSKLYKGSFCVHPSTSSLS